MSALHRVGVTCLAKLRYHRLKRNPSDRRRIFERLSARYRGPYSQPRELRRKEAMIHSPAAHRYRLLIVLVVILTVGVIVPQRSFSWADEQQSVIHQLRI